MRIENFYYECIYGVLRNTYPNGQITLLNRLKAKITNLHSNRLQRLMLHNENPNRLVGERPALFHNLQMRKKQ